MFHPKVVYEDRALPQMNPQPPFYLGGSQVPSSLGFTNVNQGAGINNGVCHTGKRYLKPDNIVKPR